MKLVYIFIILSMNGEADGRDPNVADGMFCTKRAILFLPYYENQLIFG